MARYCVNKNAQSNGDHEVHRDGCSYMPQAQNQLPLGEHYTCVTAVAAAKRVYPSANGCAYCSSACNTG